MRRVGLPSWYTACASLALTATPLEVKADTEEDAPPTFAAAASSSAGGPAHSSHSVSVGGGGGGLPTGLVILIIIFVILVGVAITCGVLRLCKKEDPHYEGAPTYSVAISNRLFKG